MSHRATIIILIYLVSVVGAGVWMFVDSRARGVDVWRWLKWAIATLLSPGFALPGYLLWGRPQGALVTCPTCGASTLGTRGACLHCEGPLEEPLPPALWGMGEVLGVAILSLNIDLVVGVILSRFALRFLRSAAGIIALTALLELLLLGLSIVVVKRYRKPLSALGISWGKVPRMVALGAGVGLAGAATALGLIYAWVYIVGLFIGRDQADAWLAGEGSKFTWMSLSGSPVQIAAMIVFVVGVLGPFAEEIFFRGLVFGALRARGIPLAVGVSALFFALLHGSVLRFPHVFLFGVAMAILYARTRTLLPGIAAHVVTNVSLLILANLLT